MLTEKIKAMTTPYNAQDYLQTEQDCLGFLDALFDEAPDDLDFVVSALNEVAQATGMRRIARIGKLTPVALFALLRGTGTPSRASVTLALSALGVQMPTNRYAQHAA